MAPKRGVRRAFVLQGAKESWLPARAPLLDVAAGHDKHLLRKRRWAGSPAELPRQARASLAFTAISLAPPAPITVGIARILLSLPAPERTNRRRGPVPHRLWI